MALSIYLSISILLLHFTYHVEKPLNFLQNAVIFMVGAIFTRQCLTLLALEWGMYKMTTDDWLFLCLILCRDLLTPITIMLFANYYVRSETWISKVAAFAGSLVVLLAFHELAVYFELITYSKWNFFYTTLLNAGFLFSAIAVLKVISTIQSLENRKNESL